MIKIKDKYLKDSQGRPIGVVLDIKEYRKILKKLEELDAIRAYDSAKSSPQEAIPFGQAVKEIERKRK